MTTIVVNEKKQLEGIRLNLLLIAIALAAFLISLDGFIVNVAVPTISGELGVPSDVGTWIITLFSTTSTVFVPISGYLSSRFGNEKIFLIGIIFFTLGSFLCGIAPSYTFLLFARVIQGASAGLLVPVSLALILSYFPQEKQTVGIGFWSFFVMVGPAMGPMIGGWLSDYRWHWMFFLNIPICVFSLLTVASLTDRSSQKKSDYSSLDFVGMGLLFICISSLQSAMNRWNIYDWFRSNVIIALFVLSATCLVLFIIWETFYSRPLIDFQLIRKRMFALPALCMSLGMGVIFSSFVLDSLWVQEVLGYTPAWAGLSLAPVGLFPLICYPLIGKVVRKLDLRVWIIASFILYSATFFWLSQITVYTAFWQLALPRLVQGIGFATFTVPNSALVIRGVEPARLTHVISLFSFFRMFSVGFFISGSITLWIFRTAFYQTILAARTAYNSPLLQALFSPFERVTQEAAQAKALGYQALVNQASTLALADIYYLFGWLFLGFCVIVFFYKK